MGCHADSRSVTFGHVRCANMRLIVRICISQRIVMESRSDWCVTDAIREYMTGNSLSKTITKTRYTAEFKFTGYWFSDEVSLNWQGAYEAIFEAQGNRATPCRLTITATEYIEQLRINGLSCGEIIIDTIPRGATVIIDGETGFATMDGENKFKDVSLMEFPYLTTGQEKEHHLIFSDNNALVTLQYKPMWL